MSEFFKAQMDYVFFVYGLAFILLAAVTYNMRADSTDSPKWQWLGFFALLHGINEWADMIVLSLETTGVYFNTARFIIMLASFLCLFEFGRTGLVVFRQKPFPVYYYFPFLIAPLFAFSYGIAGMSAVTRSSCGLFGGVLAGIVMLRFGINVRKRRFGNDFIFASAFMLAYALLTGLVTHKTDFFPGNILNHESFMSIFRLPVQIFRAASAVFISVFIWRYYCVWKNERFSSSFKRMRTYQQLVYVAIAVVIVLGWIVTEAGARKADGDERAHVLKTAALVASAIDPSMVASLNAEPSDKDLDEFSRLKTILTQFGDSQPDIRYLYIMGKNPEGKVFFYVDSCPTRLIESSTFAEPGEIYPDATKEFLMAFENGHKFVEGPVSDEWGTWISGLAPVFSEGNPKPLAIVGIDLDAARWKLMIAEARRLPIFITLLVSCLMIMFFTVQIQSEDVKEALKNSERTLRDVLDHVHDAISVHTISGEILDVNNRMLDLYRLDAESLKKLSVTRDLTVDQAGADTFRALWRRALREGNCFFEWRTLRPADGFEFDVDVYLCRMNLADRPVVVATVRDITERKKVEDELRILSNAIEQSPASVIITDKSGLIQYVNPRAVSLSGFSANEIMGRKIASMNFEICLEDSGRKDKIMDAVLSGKEWHGEMRHIVKSGGFYWAQASISPIRDKNGKITHHIFVSEDITDRKQAAIELEKAKEAAENANRAKSLFLANMSHEIRTPLNAILGFSQLLGKDDSLDLLQQKQLNIINKSGEHLLSLINSVLEMSKIESGTVSLDITSIDIHGMVCDLDIVFRARAEAKNIEFEFLKSDNMPKYVMADEIKLRQILTNLLGNALKFTDSGKIRFSVTSEIMDGDEGACKLVFEVEDTGSGIDANEVEKLFRYFEQAQSSAKGKGGTGLGLAISREFARLMGGDINVRSEYGQGSVFTANIRAAISRISDHRQSYRNIVAVSSESLPVNVHVVDDMDANRFLLKSILEPKGFTYSESSNGAEALENIKRIKPDIVLMDMLMPVMDGYTATKILKTSPETSSIAVIAVTASAFEEEKNRILEIGSDGYIRKPFNIGELLETIKTVVGIEYIYKDDHTEKTEDLTKASLENANLLSALPEELRLRIRDATVSADYDMLMELVEEVAEISKKASEYLVEQVSSYNYEAIVHVLDGSL